MRLKANAASVSKVGPVGTSEDDTPKALAQWNDTYERDWKFFATDQTVEYKGHRYQGLALPGPVLGKIFHANAVRWLPGITGKP